MPFAMSQVLLWKFLYQNPCNIYANMHSNRMLFLVLLLTGLNSNILSYHHSDSRSPQLDHQTNMPLYQYMLVCKCKVEV